MINLDFVEKDYERALAILRERRNRESSFREKYLIEKVEQSLKLLRLGMINKEDSYALELLNKVTLAVAKSKSMRDTSLSIIHILQEDELGHTSATAEVRALHEVAEVILGKEDDISVLQKRIKMLQNSRDKVQQQSQIAYLIILIFILIGLVSFLIYFFSSVRSELS